MTPLKNNLIDHFKVLMSATEAAGIEAIMGIKEFAVHLRQGERVATLQPQFMAHVAGKTLYAPALTEEAFMFAGWLPYRNKRWPIASSKLAFKRYVAAAGLDTPGFSGSPTAPLADCIIKNDSSSFGAHIEGPFRFGALNGAARERKQYLESFVEGTIAKVWFWNSTPICMESDRMPTLVGDGQSNILRLLQHRLRMIARLTPVRAEALLQQIDIVLTYYGLTRATVLEDQRRQVVEFRYGSELSAAADRAVIDLTAPSQQERAARWERIGKVLDDAIPAEIRANTLFSVDAIIDADHKIWLLEMNSNPTVHPLCYPKLISSLFPQESKASKNALIPASAFH